MASFNKDHDQRFKDIIDKIKKGAITKEEKILPFIPQDLQDELRKYHEQDLE